MQSNFGRFGQLFFAERTLRNLGSMKTCSTSVSVALCRTVGISALLALTACGGGGGATTTPVAATPAATPSASTPVAITTLNAKAVAANALAATTNGVNLVGTIGFGLINGSPVDATFLNKPQACNGGGTAVVTGSVASSSGLTTGDSLNPTYTNCGVPMLGTTLTLNGSSTQTLTSGSANKLPFQITFSGNLNNLSIGIAGKTSVLNGDQILDWSVGSNTAVQTMITSGTSLTNKSNVSGLLRTHVWQNYKQTIGVNGVTNSFSLSGTVQSDNTNLSPVGGSYTLSATTPIVQSTSTLVLSGGVIKIMGAANSQILATVGANNVVTLQVDAKGDGTFQSTIATTMAELNTFL